MAGDEPVGALVRQVMAEAASDIQRHYPGLRRRISAHAMTPAQVAELFDVDDMAERYLELRGQVPEQAPPALRRALAAHFTTQLEAEYESFIRRYPVA